jgi:hypothetical protein
VASGKFFTDSNDSIISSVSLAIEDNLAGESKKLFFKMPKPGSFQL